MDEPPSNNQPDGADILVVDDNAVSLLIASGLLRKGGHESRTARDGQEAQRAIGTKTPSLVLVDLNMPEMSGLELCEWVKRQPGLGEIPVLFLSSTTDPAQKAEAFRKGAADFITKPFQAEEFLLRIGLHLKLSEQQKALRRSIAEREVEVQQQLSHYHAELLKLQSAVEQSPSSVLMTDCQGHIEYVNLKFTETTGYGLEEIRGKTPSILRAPDTPAKVYTEMWGTISQGRIWRGVIHNRRKDGSLYWERTLIAPLRTKDGSSISHYVALKEDITLQLETEAQLRQGQKMEAIGQLAAGIAHEINTPAQFVSDNLSFLKDAFDDLLALLQSYRHALSLVGEVPEHKQLLADLRAVEERADIDYVRTNASEAFQSSLDGIKRIGAIVRAMKEFSHPDQREMEPADLNAAILNTLTIARNEYKYVAEVETTLGELPLVPCHLGDIRQVLLNILVNAAHAIGDAVGRTGKRGLIRIRSIAEGDAVRVEIEDTGTGIPESAREHVFEPFFTTKEVGRGTGQGLAIAHNIVVKKHKGTLSFVTTLGKGTTFVIRLPTMA
jgi:two-component system, NtrC family, sensor kinase